MKTDINFYSLLEAGGLLLFKEVSSLYTHTHTHIHFCGTGTHMSWTNALPHEPGPQTHLFIYLFIHSFIHFC
jgi:hypothetical protein